MVSAMNVANYFLQKANNEGDLLTNLKIQKLLYYAQAWYLVNFKSSLFGENIIAWNLGPVVQEIYDEFKKFGASPIIYKETNTEANFFTVEQKEFLDEFYDIFIKFSAHELVNMSHNELPWKDAIKSSNKIISTDSIKKYYTELLNDDNKKSKK
jgi:uncharacterized phage-associated protein